MPEQQRSLIGAVPCKVQISLAHSKEMAYGLGLRSEIKVRAIVHVAETEGFNLSGCKDATDN